MDFVIGLANSVFNLPDGQVMFLSNSNKGRTVKSILLVKKLLGLVQMMSGLVNAAFSLPEGQAIKMIFFAPCTATSRHEIKVFRSAGITLGRYTKEVAPCTDKEKHVHGRASDRVQQKMGNSAAFSREIMRQERSIMRQIMRFF